MGLMTDMICDKMDREADMKFDFAAERRIQKSIEEDKKTKFEKWKSSREAIIKSFYDKNLRYKKAENSQYSRAEDYCTIDALIAHCIMGYRFASPHDTYGTIYIGGIPTSTFVNKDDEVIDFLPTIKLVDALSVVNQLMEDGFEVNMRGINGFHVSIKSQEQIIKSRSKKLEEAICRTCFKLIKPILNDKE